MQTRIGHVHVRYCVPNGSPSASLAVAALNRIVRERIAVHCDHDLAGIFDNDPTVYVLRQVSARVGILAPKLDLESQVAQQWSRRLSAAVVRSISAAEDADLVRFQNQSEFVARFLTDLTFSIDAWDRWYYGAFRSYRDNDEGDAILAVLEDNRECFWEVLKRLRQSNALDSIIFKLGPERHRRLWSEVARPGDDEPPAEAFRIFIHAAFLLIDALDAWATEGPTESDVLDAYLRTRPASPQWTDTASLAEAVVAVIGFLAREGSLLLAHSLDGEQKSRLDQITSTDFDWLDINYLKRRVIEVVEQRSKVNTRSLIRRPPGATPLQRRSLETLSEIVAQRGYRFDVGDSTTQATLFQLAAALAQTEDTGAIPSLLTTLESIVEASMVIGRSLNLSASLSQLKSGSLQSILDLTPPGAREALEHHLLAVLQMGSPAMAVVEELAGRISRRVTRGHTASIESRCAGLFLLVRAVQDTRLKAVLDECGFEAIEPLLTALAIRISGRLAWSQDGLDPGAALWAGIEPGTVEAQLRLLETLEYARFEEGMLNLLSAQRVTGLSETHNFYIDSSALPCSTETAAMVDRVATWLLRAWSRWLPGLGDSSVPYLLNNFIRRPGRIELETTSLEVHLEAAPLDAILRMAGYFDDAPAAPWLNNRTVRFLTTS